MPRYQSNSTLSRRSGGAAAITSDCTAHCTAEVVDTPGPYLRNVLLPSRCPICDALGPAPCLSCRQALLPPPALPIPPALDRLAVVFAYEGAGRGLITRLKYGNARSSLAW